MMPDETGELPYDLFEVEATDRWGQNVGKVSLRVHPPHLCQGRPCTVHNPSDHHMRQFPQFWRDSRKVMERVCDHGVGHLDPDEINRQGAHACCATQCCVPPPARGATMTEVDALSDPVKQLQKELTVVTQERDEARADARWLRFQLGLVSQAGDQL